MTRRARARRLYANVIRSGQAAGEFRSIPAERAADLLMAMNRSMLCDGDKRLPAARVAGLILDVFLDGMAVPGGKRK
jgi:hypothetical protein